MPLYDYGCPSCNNQKEVQHSMSEIGKIVVICNSCGSVMKKQLSAPTLVGFDNIGRSVSKKDQEAGTKKEVSTKSESPAKTQAA
jgi:putative FmdB family regulatory protein